MEMERMAKLAKEGGILLSIAAILMLLFGILFLYGHAMLEQWVFAQRYLVLGSVNIAFGFVGLIGGINAIKKRNYYASIGCGVVPLIFVIFVLLFLEFSLHLWILILWVIGLNLIAISYEDFKKQEDTDSHL